MNIPLWSSVSGMVVLVASTGYQYIFISRWADKEADKITGSSDPASTKVYKNLALADRKSKRVRLVVAATFAALIVSYGLSIYDAATDTKERRLETIESQVTSLKILVGERR
jgi:hypothetical protein